MHAVNAKVTALDARETFSYFSGSSKVALSGGQTRVAHLGVAREPRDFCKRRRRYRIEAVATQDAPSSQQPVQPRSKALEGFLPSSSTSMVPRVLYN